MALEPQFDNNLYSIAYYGTIAASSNSATQILDLKQSATQNQLAHPVDFWKPWSVSIRTNFNPCFLQCKALTSLLVGIDLAVRFLPLVENSPHI